MYSLFSKKGTFGDYSVMCYYAGVVKEPVVVQIQTLCLLSTTLFLQQKVVLNQQSVLGALALFLFFSLLLLLSFYSIWLLKRLSSNSSREV